MNLCDEESVVIELETFIRSQFHIIESDPLFVRTANLWEEGFVDSTGLVEMIAFLEERFGIVLPDEVLFEPAFTSINGIAGCVARIAREEAA